MSFELIKRDWKSYIAMLTQDAPPVFRMGWLSTIKNQWAHLRLFHSSNTNNYTGWNSAFFDQGLEKIRSKIKAHQTALQLDQLLTQKECIVIPLFHYRQYHVLSTNWKGLRVNPFGVVSIEKLQKDSPKD
ncbi:MAG: hypothetical protein CL678_08960 [Bdellovibrionaceae bacterium]|nr:hypothetical protein [Pseudobdellovibrionaceae bacterium]